MPYADLRTPLAIGLGAISGALSRYYLGLWITQASSLGFPWGTFSVNLVGAGLMGFCTTLALEHRWGPEPRLLLFVGFLGSFTTFSTYALDTVELLRSQQLPVALAYWLGSAGLGLVSLWLGMRLAQGLLGL